MVNFVINLRTEEGKFDTEVIFNKPIKVFLYIELKILNFSFALSNYAFEVIKILLLTSALLHTNARTVHSYQTMRRYKSKCLKLADVRVGLLTANTTKYIVSHKRICQNL